MEQAKQKSAREQREEFQICMTKYHGLWGNAHDAVFCAVIRKALMGLGCAGTAQNSFQLTTKNLLAILLPNLPHALANDMDFVVYLYKSGICTESTSFFSTAAESTVPDLPVLPTEDYEDAFCLYCKIMKPATPELGSKGFCEIFSVCKHGLTFFYDMAADMMKGPPPLAPNAKTGKSTGKASSGKTKSATKKNDTPTAEEMDFFPTQVTEPPDFFTGKSTGTLAARALACPPEERNTNVAAKTGKSTGTASSGKTKSATKKNDTPSATNEEKENTRSGLMELLEGHGSASDEDSPKKIATKRKAASIKGPKPPRQQSKRSRKMASSSQTPVSYTHLTLPTNREV